MKKLGIFLVFLIPWLLFSQKIVFTSSDVPNDDGSALLLEWKIDAIEAEKLEIFLNENDKRKEIFRSNVSEDNFVQGNFIYSNNVKPNQEYQFQLWLLATDGTVIEILNTKIVPKAQWFNTSKISLLILALILAVSILYFIFTARAGKEHYIRKISGLESMDEAVGRATEMGQPILFIPGTLDLDDMQTIAGLTILGKLAQKTAEHDTEILVPVCRSMVLSTAKEVVKEAYLKAGRPDSFKPDNIFYLTDDQFGFVAGVDGIIVRDKPAANFFLGAFYAESLILAETGFSSGSIQTAGTAMPSQLPFFVAACDYTLIGEELFAASAYLSKDPQQLGSLKGQDVGKAVFVTVLFIGIILEIAGIHFLKDFLTIH